MLLNNIQKKKALYYGNIEKNQYIGTHKLFQIHTNKRLFFIIHREIYSTKLI